MNKDEKLIETIELYSIIKKSLYVLYKEDMIESTDTAVLNDISLIVEYLKGEPLEEINDLFEDLQKLNKPPELQVEAEIHDNENIRKITGYIVSNNIVFLPGNNVKEVYIKYQNIIHIPTKILFNEENVITLLQFKENSFKNVFSFSTTDTKEAEGVEVTEDKITKYGKISGNELKRMFECIILDKPIIPEIEYVPCNFKDFVGHMFIKDAVKVSKVNHGEKYKVGNIILPDGKII